MQQLDARFIQKLRATPQQQNTGYVAHSYTGWVCPHVLQANKKCYTRNGTALRFSVNAAILLSAS